MERHPLDPLSLGFGLLFAVTGVAFLVGGVPRVDLRWVGPLALLVLGLWLVGSVLASSRRRSGEPSDREPADTEPAGAEPAGPEPVGPEGDRRD